jgi:hypothetical protein
MYLGAYIILARPLLVEAAKATVDLPTEINGLTTLDASNEAKVWFVDGLKQLVL